MYSLAQLSLSLINFASTMKNKPWTVFLSNMAQKLPMMSGRTILIFKVKSQKSRLLTIVGCALMPRFALS